MGDHEASFLYWNLSGILFHWSYSTLLKILFCLASWLVSSHSIFNYWTLLHSLQTEILSPIIFPLLLSFHLLTLAGKGLGLN